MKRIFALCFSLTALVATTWAQQVSSVQGTICDDLGEPLIGASVRLVGTRLGTVTDEEGNFVLNIPPDAQKPKVEISYLGYIPQTFTDLTKRLNVNLKPNDKSLEEVVVVGYGTQKAKNVTGSIESITPEEFKDLNVTNLGEALSGMISGLHVSMTGSKPGDAAHLTIRQSTELAKNWGSINAKFSDQDDTPLYIIDDFISSETAFNNLDPSEVESISVLKDAAAAIYGAQGAYGVVLVKTKHGRVGAPKISYSGQVGFTQRLFTPKMMNAQQWARAWNAYMGTPDETDSETKANQYFQSDEIEALSGVNYQPLDDEWSAALTHKHSVNIDGGTDNATYFAGVSYNTQDGNLGRLNYDRWNYRAGATASISKYLKANVQISGNTSYKKTPRNRYSSATTDDGDYAILMQHLPFMPISVDGKHIVYNGITGENAPSGNQIYNWDAIQESSDHNENRSNTFQFNSSLDLDFGFWKTLKGLHAKVSYSKSIANSENNIIATDMYTYTLINRGGSYGHLFTGDTADYSYDNLNSWTLSNGETLSRSMSRSDSYQLNFTVNYNRKFGDHDVTALFSIERGESWAETLEGTSSGTPLQFTDGQSNSITPSSNDDVTNAEWGRTESGRMSYIGRANYSYQDKYLFEALFRSDASAKFSPKNYWGNFPSFSAGWVISQESWFNKEKTHLDFLKIRGSWGLMGRDNVNSYIWLTRYNRDLSKGAIFGSNSTTKQVGYGMVIEQGGANEDAHWDKTYKTNFGINARMLDSRLSIDYDFYYDRGREIFSTYLGTSIYPTTVGVQATPENFAELDDWGHEINIGWRDKFGEKGSYWVRLSTGYSDNKVIKCADIVNPDRDDLVEGKRKDHGIWGLQCIGMFKSYQQIEEYFDQYNITEYMGYTKDKVRPGMLIYKDVNGTWDSTKKRYNPEPDGIVDASDDLVQISKRSDNPWGATINLGAKWNGFSVQAQISGSWGSYMMVPSTVRKSYTALTSEYGNIPTFWKDMFVYEDVIDASGVVTVPANTDSNIPNFRYGINMNESTYWRIKATRISIPSLSFGYEMPRKLVSRIGMSSCRFNVTCQNVASIVSPHYKDAWSAWGGNYSYYPNLRKITMGVNVSF